MATSSSASFVRKSQWSSVSWFGLGPSIPVDAVKACALVGLHMMTKEDSWRTDSGSSFSSSSSSENNVGNGALFVIRLRLVTQLPSSCKTGRWQR